MATPQATEADLFMPVELGPLTLSNRIVMAPMTRNRASEQFVPSPLMTTYYEQRAGAGLIVTEAAQVARTAVGYPRTPGIHEEAQVHGWQQVTRAVHARGGRIFIQLWHAGRISHASLQPAGADPVAPSAIRPAGEVMTAGGKRPYGTPRALATGEVPAIVAEFRDAAQCARQAGFDGVELHAANGYLLDQFLRDHANRRDDRYGGPIRNRIRLMLEVTEAVVGVWGSERVGVHISPLVDVHDVRDSDPQRLFTELVRALDPLGIAYIHVFETRIPHPQQPSPPFELRRLREAYSGTYVANGGYDAARAAAAVRSGAADLVSFGRRFIANPDLPARIRARAAPCDPVPQYYYEGGARGYTDYPCLG